MTSKVQMSSYHDESGKIKGGPNQFFTNGIFAPRDYFGIQEAVLNIRRSFNFTSEFKFGKVSKLRYNVYNKILKAIEPFDWQFIVVLVDKKKIPWPDFKNQPYKAYNHIFSLLCQHKAVAGTLIYTDERELSRDDDFYAKHTRIKAIDSKQNDFLQVADLMVGAVRYYHDNKDNEQAQRYKMPLAKLVVSLPKVEITKWP